MARMKSGQSRSTDADIVEAFTAVLKANNNTPTLLKSLLSLSKDKGKLLDLERKIDMKMIRDAISKVEDFALEKQGYFLQSLWEKQQDKEERIQKRNEKNEKEKAKEKPKAKPKGKKEKEKEKQNEKEKENEQNNTPLSKKYQRRKAPATPKVLSNANKPDSNNNINKPVKEEEKEKEKEKEENPQKEKTQVEKERDELNTSAITGDYPSDEDNNDVDVDIDDNFPEDSDDHQNDSQEVTCNLSCKFLFFLLYC